MTKYKNISSLFILLSAFCCNAAFSMYEDNNSNQNIIVVNEKNRLTEQYHLTLLSNDRTQEQENELIDLIYNGIVLESKIEKEKREIRDLEEKIKKDERYYGLLIEFDMKDELKEHYEIILEKAQSNNSYAQYILGLMYEFGKGVDKNYEEAFNWFEKAANQEYAFAQYRFGRIHHFYLHHTFGIKRDDKKAFELYKKAAIQGCARAQYALGLMYLDGFYVVHNYTKSVDKNYRKYFEWIEKAANQGFAYAQTDLELTICLFYWRKRWTKHLQKS
ncbi:MAG: tetratricopeptide repeat protein [Alphaproteobacteria bacterium]|nr:tetratricopeptide repeat protein [Alphaproteobacteria bacterium]